MLMEVKNQLNATFLSIKYALQREMLNKVTFFSNIVFMLLNNASFIVQWIIIYSIRDDVGGYSFKQVLLLWGLAALTYGISRFFFKNVFDLPEIINSGKLDNYLVQPKNVLISCITSSVEVSALGDILYGYIMFFLYGFSVKGLLLFTITGIGGAFILVSTAIIWGSLTFWFGKTEMISNTLNSIMTNFATYPEGIFKGFIKVMFYTFLPLALSVYVPIQLISNFNILHFILLLFAIATWITLSFVVFYNGLKKYSSTNLMNVRI